MALNLASDQIHIESEDLPSLSYAVKSRLESAVENLPAEMLTSILELSQEQLIATLAFRVSAALSGQLPPSASEFLRARSESESEMMFLSKRPSVASSAGQEPKRVLAVDIGATRTKFMLQDLNDDGLISPRLLEPAMSEAIWVEPRDEDKVTQVRRRDSFNLVTAARDVLEPADAAKNLHSHLLSSGIELRTIDRIVFSVPGTVDLNRVSRDEMTVVKNMPSFSPKFRGFDFKKAFLPLLGPNAKVSAVADNLAAAMGVACTHSFTSGLVLVLGTAPAVATFFRQENKVTLGRQDSYLETAIWQSWVWFSKIPLNDPYGYCGGINVHDGGKSYSLRSPDHCKMPHHQARIRFALDDATWKRLRGQHKTLPQEKQGSLSEEEATRIWADRLQSAVNVLALKFHAIYGPPESIFVLGGNSMRCHGRVTQAQYTTPDISTGEKNSIKVHIMPNDEAQQRIHMAGLVNSTKFKVKHVFAPGSDPLSRGWTRGGEIYVWVPRSKKKERDMPSRKSTGGMSVGGLASPRESWVDSDGPWPR